MWWDRQWWGQVLREPLMVTRGAPTLPREDQVEREKQNHSQLRMGRKSSRALGRVESDGGRARAELYLASLANRDLPSGWP